MKTKCNPSFRQGIQYDALLVHAAEEGVGLYRLPHAIIVIYIQETFNLSSIKVKLEVLQRTVHEFFFFQPSLLSASMLWRSGRYKSRGRKVEAAIKYKEN